MNVQLRLPSKVRPEMMFMGSQAYDGILANGNKAREVGDSTLAMTLRRACNVCIVCTYK